MQVICRLNEVLKGAAGVSARRHKFQVVTLRVFSEAAIAEYDDTEALGDELVDARPHLGRVCMTAAAWNEEDDRALRVHTEVSLEAEADLPAVA